MRPTLPGASAFAHRVVSQRRSSCRITMRALLRRNQTPPSDGLEKGTSHVARSRQYPGFGPWAGCHWHPYTAKTPLTLQSHFWCLWPKPPVVDANAGADAPMAHGPWRRGTVLRLNVSHCLPLPVVPKFPKLGRTDHLQHPGLAWQERICQAGTEQPANFHLLSHHAHELILSTASR